MNDKQQHRTLINFGHFPEVFTSKLKYSICLSRPIRLTYSLVTFLRILIIGQKNSFANFNILKASLLRIPNKTSIVSKEQKIKPWLPSGNILADFITLFDYYDPSK